MPPRAMKPTSEVASIVMLGSFNPAIFQPSWLALKSLMTPADAQAAEVRLIAPQVAAFKAGGFVVEVLQERFAAQVEEPQDQVRLRDLVTGILSLLGETPVNRLGLNWVFTFRLADETRWHALGDYLAPKAPWAGLLRGRPGLRTLTIQGALAAGLRGQVNVRLEPTTPPSVRLEVNHDILGLDGDTPVTAETFAEIIHTQWEAARRDAASIAAGVVTAGAPA